MPALDIIQPGQLRKFLGFYLCDRDELQETVRGHFAVEMFQETDGLKEYADAWFNEPEKAAYLFLSHQLAAILVNIDLKLPANFDKFCSHLQHGPLIDGQFLFPLSDAPPPEKPKPLPLINSSISESMIPTEVAPWAKTMLRHKLDGEIFLYEERALKFMAKCVNVCIQMSLEDWQALAQRSCDKHLKPFRWKTNLWLHLCHNPEFAALNKALFTQNDLMYQIYKICDPEQKQLKSYLVYKYGKSTNKRDEIQHQEMLENIVKCIPLDDLITLAENDIEIAKVIFTKPGLLRCENSAETNKALAKIFHAHQCDLSVSDSFISLFAPVIGSIDREDLARGIRDIPSLSPISRNRLQALIDTKMLTEPEAKDKPSYLDLCLGLDNPGIITPQNIANAEYLLSKKGQRFQPALKKAHISRLIDIVNAHLHDQKFKLKQAIRAYITPGTSLVELFDERPFDLWLGDEVLAYYEPFFTRLDCEEFDNRTRDFPQKDENKARLHRIITGRVADGDVIDVSDLSLDPYSYLDKCLGLNVVPTDKKTPTCFTSQHFANAKHILRDKNKHYQAHLNVQHMATIIAMAQTQPQQIKTSLDDLLALFVKLNRDELRKLLVEAANYHAGLSPAYSERWQHHAKIGIQSLAAYIFNGAKKPKFEKLMLDNLAVFDVLYAKGNRDDKESRDDNDAYKLASKNIPVLAKISATPNDFLAKLIPDHEKKHFDPIASVVILQVATTSSGNIFNKWWNKLKTAVKETFSETFISLLSFIAESDKKAGPSAPRAAAAPEAPPAHAAAELPVVDAVEAIAPAPAPALPEKNSEKYSIACALFTNSQIKGKINLMVHMAPLKDADRMSAGRPSVTRSLITFINAEEANPIILRAIASDSGLLNAIRNTPASPGHESLLTPDFLATKSPYFMSAKLEIDVVDLLLTTPFEERRTPGLDDSAKDGYVAKQNEFIAKYATHDVSASAPSMWNHKAIRHTLEHDPQFFNLLLITANQKKLMELLEAFPKLILPKLAVGSVDSVVSPQAQKTEVFVLDRMLVTLFGEPKLDEVTKEPLEVKLPRVEVVKAIGTFLKTHADEICLTDKQNKHLYMLFQRFLTPEQVVSLASTSVVFGEELLKDDQTLVPGLLQRALIAGPDIHADFKIAELERSAAAEGKTVPKDEFGNVIINGRSYNDYYVEERISQTNGYIELVKQALIYNREHPVGKTEFLARLIHRNDASVGIFFPMSHTDLKDDNYVYGERESYVIRASELKELITGTKLYEALIKEGITISFKQSLMLSKLANEYSPESLAPAVNDSITSRRLGEEHLCQCFDEKGVFLGGQQLFDMLFQNDEKGSEFIGLLLNSARLTEEHIKKIFTENSKFGDLILANIVSRKLPGTPVMLERCFKWGLLKNATSAQANVLYAGNGELWKMIFARPETNPSDVNDNVELFTQLLLDPAQAEWRATLSSDMLLQKFTLDHKLTERFTRIVGQQPSLLQTLINRPPFILHDAARDAGVGLEATLINQITGLCYSVLDRLSRSHDFAAEAHGIEGIMTAHQRRIIDLLNSEDSGLEELEKVAVQVENTINVRANLDRLNHVALIKLILMHNNVKDDTKQIVAVFNNKCVANVISPELIEALARLTMKDTRKVFPRLNREWATEVIKFCIPRINFCLVCAKVGWRFTPEQLEVIANTLLVRNADGTFTVNEDLAREFVSVEGDFLASLNRLFAAWIRKLPDSGFEDINARNQCVALFSNKAIRNKFSAAFKTEGSLRLLLDWVDAPTRAAIEEEIAREPLPSTLASAGTSESGGGEGLRAGPSRLKDSGAAGSGSGSGSGSEERDEDEEEDAEVTRAKLKAAYEKGKAAAKASSPSAGSPPHTDSPPGTERSVGESASERSDRPLIAGSSGVAGARAVSPGRAPASLFGGDKAAVDATAAAARAAGAGAVVGVPGAMLEKR